MRIRKQGQFGRRGSVLLLTLLASAIIGGLLASYLGMVQQEHRMSQRSLTWNSALVHAESGVEEALTRLEYSGLTGSGNGWYYYNGYYRKQRNFAGGGYAVVLIQNVNPPVITSRGYYPVPLSSSDYVVRRIRVTTTNSALFAKGIVAKGQINLNGNRIRTDSFDSSNPQYSILGLYNPFSTKDNGDVATNSGLVNSLNVGNADIHGKVATGPGGSVAIGNNGAVGDHAWHAAGNNGIQPGYVTDDMNLSFPDVRAPYTSGGLVPLAGIVDGMLYNYVLGNGNYQMSSINMSGSQNMVITGNAKLYVSGNVKVSGLSSITIAPGGKLELYVAGATTDLGGVGVINRVGLAQNFLYYGLPTNTSISLNGNAVACMAMYAPQANVTMNGSGNFNIVYDLCGAIVANTVTMNGHFNFHYDENLMVVGPSRGYTVTSWLEE